MLRFMGIIASFLWGFGTSQVLIGMFNMGCNADIVVGVGLLLAGAGVTLATAPQWRETPWKQ